MKQFLKNKNIKILYIAAALLLLTAVMLGLLLGPSGISPAELIASVGRDTPEARILYFVRIPRTLACIVCGAALAVSGAVIQGVLANKLASPSIIGVNSGAGLAVTLCAALGILGGWRMALAAFVGAFAAVMAVSLAAKKWGASSGTLILLGVAMNSIFGAVTDTVITVDPDAGVMSRDFKVGDFSSVTYEKLIPATVIIAVSILILLTLSNELSVLTLGEDNARGVGLDTGIMRALFLVLAAFLAGAAVSVCGLLSFVGLLVPHAVRRFTSGGAAQLLPLSALFGGGFVSVCDSLARTLFSPYEIPVGIIMAFLGAPFFIYILIKGRGVRHGDRD